MIKLLFFVVLFTHLTNIFSQERGKPSYPFFKGQRTKIQNPFQLRDPFREKRVKKSVSSSAKKKKMGSLLSNRPKLGLLDLQEIKIVGIFLGKNRKALARLGSSGSDAKGEVYILTEGMKLGKNRAEVKAILPGGVVLVERIKNVYDQNELLETILPLYSND